MRQPKVLIVEDDPRWVIKIGQLLKSQDYQIICGNIDTVERAITAIQKNIPDLVILDIELKDSATGGIEVAKYIRDNHLMVRIIYLTNWNDRALRTQAAQIRYNYYLTKNSADEAILLEIEMALRFPLEELYDSKILKANGQVMYAGGNFAWIKGRTVAIAQISFIEAEGYKSRIYLLNAEVIIVTLYLNKIMKALKHPHLMRVHKSYVVNISAITNMVNPEYIYVVNAGSKNDQLGIDVSKKYSKKLQEEYLRFAKAEEK